MESTDNACSFIEMKIESTDNACSFIEIVMESTDNTDRKYGQCLLVHRDREYARMF